MRKNLNRNKYLKKFSDELDVIARYIIPDDLSEKERAELDEFIEDRKNKVKTLTKKVKKTTR